LSGDFFANINIDGEELAVERLEVIIGTEVEDFIFV